MIVRKAWKTKATARATGEGGSGGALWRGTSRNRARKRKEIIEEGRGGKIRGGSYGRGLGVDFTKVDRFEGLRGGGR